MTTTDGETFAANPTGLVSANAKVAWSDGTTVAWQTNAMMTVVVRGSHIYAVKNGLVFRDGLQLSTFGVTDIAVTGTNILAVGADGRFYQIPR